MRSWKILLVAIAIGIMTGHALKCPDMEGREVTCRTNPKSCITVRINGVRKYKNKLINYALLNI